MNSLDLSENYFINFFEKTIRHFEILNLSYNDFETEFTKTQNFVINSDSQILKQKFRFLLPDFLDKPSKNMINFPQLREEIKSIKCLLSILIHLSKSY